MEPFFERNRAAEAQKAFYAFIENASLTLRSAIEQCSRSGIATPLRNTLYLYFCRFGALNFSSTKRLKFGREKNTIVLKYRRSIAAPEPLDGPDHAWISLPDS